MNTATILFKNDTTLTTEQNGDCFILSQKPTFPDDLSVVTVTGVEGTTVFRNAKIVECYSIDGRYWFAFVEKTENELFKEFMQESIAAIEDALCELDKEETE